MRPPSASEANGRERLWRALLFWFSAVMAGFALVEFDAGRPAGAAGDAGVSFLMLSLMNQFPVVRALIVAASRRGSAEELRRRTEEPRGAHPWSDRLAGLGWTLLLASLILRALGAE